MNEIKIEKLITHHVDMKKRVLVMSDTLSNIDEISDLEYYITKIENAWNSNKRKEVILGDHAPIKHQARNMYLNDEGFIQSSKMIANDFYHLNLMIIDVPTFDIVCIEAFVEDKPCIFILKLNYQVAKLNVLDGEEIVINEMDILPNLKAPVDEAIIVADENQVFVLEKKFNIDGKMDTYINNQYLKGELRLSDKEKLSLVYKIAKKVNSTFAVTTFDIKVMVNSVLLEKLSYEQEINIHQLLDTVFERDYNAKEEAIDILLDLGIDEQETIQTVHLDKNKLSKVKIKGDEFDVTVNIQAYLNEEGINISDNTIKIDRESPYIEVRI